MAVDMFVKIDDVKGESMDDKHKDEIQILHFSWGAVNSFSFEQGTGGGVSKVSVHDISIVKKMDKSSPILAALCAQGDHKPTLTISCRKAGGTQEDYFKFKAKNVAVTSYQVSVGSDDSPIENVAFSFASYQLDYKPQDDKGNTGASVLSGWDVQQNKKI